MMSTNYYTVEVSGRSGWAVLGRCHCFQRARRWARRYRGSLEVRVVDRPSEIVMLGPSGVWVDLPGWNAGDPQYVHGAHVRYEPAG